MAFVRRAMLGAELDAEQGAARVVAQVESRLRPSDSSRASDRRRHASLRRHESHHRLHVRRRRVPRLGQPPIQRYPT